MRMTSMVVPSPSIIFTSKTVHCTALKNCSWTFSRVCVRETRVWSKSGIPSPVMAEVGTTLMKVRTSGLSQYNAALRPSLANSSMIFRARSSNSDFECCFWAARLSLAAAFVCAFQSYMRSILFSAMMNGVFRIRSIFNDSKVWGSNPCMISTTRMAMSHNDEPRLRRFVNDSCPGVSITRMPGTFMSKSPLFSA